MRYVRLGGSSLSVSSLVLGGLSFGTTERFRAAGGNGIRTARRMIDQALDSGVNMIDTADLYSFGESERIVGSALKGKRDQVFIATKTGIPLGPDGSDAGSSPARLRGSIDASLARLNTDRLDLYYLHQWDGITPIEDSMAELAAAVAAGKIRHIGISNFSGWQVVKAVRAAADVGCPPPVVHQVYYTPEAREVEYEIIPANLDCELHTMVWGALGEGLLTRIPDLDGDVGITRRRAAGWLGPYVADQQRVRRVVEVLRDVAASENATVPQVVYAWLLTRPSVACVALGARTQAQLADSLAAVHVVLSDEHEAAITAAAAPQPLYPYWHRALLGMALADPAESTFLRGYAAALGLADS